MKKTPITSFQASTPIAGIPTMQQNDDLAYEYKKSFEEAISLRDSGDIEGAKKALRKIIDIFPERHGAMIVLGGILLEEERCYDDDREGFTWDGSPGFDLDKCGVGSRKFATPFTNEQIPAVLLEKFDSLLGLDDDLDRLIVDRVLEPVEAWREPLIQVEEHLNQMQESVASVDLLGEDDLG